jgi:hypothetical protein
MSDPDAATQALLESFRAEHEAARRARGERPPMQAQAQAAPRQAQAQAQAVDPATQALLNSFRDEHEAARRARGERPQAAAPRQAADPDAESRALLNRFRAENVAARRAGQPAQRPAVAAQPVQRAAAPPSIDALTQELYGDYMGANVGGQMDAVARRIHNVVSISTILGPREGRLPGGLFHGNITAAESRPTVTANPIGLIIQASNDVAGRVEPSLAGMPAQPRVVELGLRDSPDQPLSTVLDRVLPEMAQARARGINVLVNCTVGMSRSTAVILGHLMDPNGENMPLLDAWRHVKSRRPLAFPNVGFLVQLMRYEKRVRGSSSVPVDLVINHPFAALTIDDLDAYIGALRRNLRGGRRSNKRSESKRSESKRSESKRKTRRTRRYTRYS